MKIRTGFVSNSSSSSFTCAVCGTTESGWDACLEEMGFIQCENEHIHCGCEVEVTDETTEHCDYFEENVLKEEFCPICTFDVSSKYDLRRFLTKTYEITNEEVLADIKTRNKRRRKVYDIDYVNYVCSKMGLQEREILDNLRETYGVYSKFLEFLRG